MAEGTVPPRDIERIGTEKRSITVELNAAELEDRGARLARKIQEARRLKERKKAAMADFKQRSEALEVEIDTLSEAVREGSEVREVDCDIMHNYTEGIYYVRNSQDYSQIWDERPLTADERVQQRKLPLDPTYGIGSESGERDDSATGADQEEDDEQELEEAELES